VSDQTNLHVVSVCGSMVLRLRRRSQFRRRNRSVATATPGAMGDSRLRRRSPGRCEVAG
jgi:hypothetical protein